MAKKLRKALAMLLAVLMLTSTMSIPVFAAETDGETGDQITAITGTITEDTVWNDGDVVGPVTISGGTAENPIVITVNGTVTVDGQITVGGDDDANVVFTGNGTLIRGANNAGGAVVYIQGNNRIWHSVKFDGITLDGGAVWTGDAHTTLGRGTTNSGVVATGGNSSVLFVRFADVTLKNAALQNADSRGGKGAPVNLGYGKLFIEDSVVCDNYYVANRGGAIHMRNGATVIAEDTAFYGNHGGQGGVIGTSTNSAYASVMEFTDCSFTNNYSNGGGAVFHTQDNQYYGHLKVVGCEIKNNSCGTADRGIVDSSSYTVPVYFENCTIDTDECSLFGYFSNENKNLYVSGSEITGEYTGVLAEAPFKVTGALGTMTLNEATIKHLMTKYGYIAAEENYSISEADVAQMLGEDAAYVKADVNGDGKLEIVPGSVDEATAVKVIVVDGFPGSDASEEQTIYADQYPTCNFAHAGYVLGGWVEETTDEGAKQMTAQWKVARPEGVIADVNYDSVVGLEAEYTMSVEEIGNYSDAVTYTYQWYFDESKIEGATSDSYTTTGVDYGWHHYTCKVTASQDGFITSDTGVSTTDRVKVLREPEVEYVCYIKETGVYYETLTAAVADANALDGANTIVMIKDIDFDSDATLTVEGDLTIVSEEGIDHVISRGAYTGTLFTVPAGASLTLDGGIVFDGSNNWIFEKELYENDLYNRVDNPITAYAYSAEGGTVGTAAAFVVNGAMTAKEATIKNFFSTKDSNAGDAAIFKVNANATLTTDGVLIDHCATYGANTIAHLSTNSKWYIQGDTMISNNFGGRNGGICRNDSGQIYMSGGTIKDTAGKNVNGTVFMMYGTGSAFYMTGGTICGNSSVFGANNGRCAAVYLHSKSYMKMTGGTICHNVGGSRGGIDSYSSSSVLDINRVDQEFDNAEWKESGAAAYTASNHPMIVDNVSLLKYPTNDVGHSYNFDTWWVTGGIYTQDVDEFCSEGYVCIPYEDTERTDDYIVVPGYRVKYYAVEKNEVTNAETGEVTTEYTTTLLKKYFHLLPRDKFWYEMDERANYFELTDDKGGVIKTWYAEKELDNIYDFANTKLEGDLNLYGEFKYTDEAAVVLTIDMSGTMYRYKMGGKRYVDVAKAKALEFVNEYAAKVTNEGDKRLLAIARFDTDANVVLNWVDVATAEGLAAAKTAINGMKVKDNGSTSSNYVCTNFDAGVILTRNLLKQNAVSEISNKFAIILSDGAPTVTVNADTDTVGEIKSSFWGDQLDMNGKRYQIRRNGGGWTHPGEVDRTLKYLATGENNLADLTTSYGENKEGIFFVGVGGDMSVKLFNDAVYGTSNGSRTTDVKRKPAAFNYVEALQDIAQADILKMTTAGWLSNLANKVGGTYVSAKDATALAAEFDAILTEIVNS